MEAVLLDAAGTLIRPSEPVGETYAAVARRYGAELEADKLTQVFRKVFSDMPDLAFEWASMGELRRLERDWWRELVHRVVAWTGSSIDDFDPFVGLGERVFDLVQRDVSGQFDRERLGVAAHGADAYADAVHRHRHIIVQDLVRLDDPLPLFPALTRFHGPVDPWDQTGGKRYAEMSHGQGRASKFLCNKGIQLYG